MRLIDRPSARLRDPGRAIVRQPCPADPGRGRLGALRDQCTDARWPGDPGDPDDSLHRVGVLSRGAGGDLLAPAGLRDSRCRREDFGRARAGHRAGGVRRWRCCRRWPTRIPPGYRERVLWTEPIQVLVPADHDWPVNVRASRSLTMPQLVRYPLVISGNWNTGGGAPAMISAPGIRSPAPRRCRRAGHLGGDGATRARRGCAERGGHRAIGHLGSDGARPRRSADAPGGGCLLVRRCCWPPRSDARCTGCCCEAPPPPRVPCPARPAAGIARASRHRASSRQQRRGGTRVGPGMVGAGRIRCASAQATRRPATTSGLETPRMRWLRSSDGNPNSPYCRPG